MKVRYFQDTDTLSIELRVGEITETTDLDENTQIDLDAEGESSPSRSSMPVSVRIADVSRSSRSEPESGPVTR